MAGFCHPICVHEIEHVYNHCSDLSLVIFSMKLETIVAIFQQYVYYYAIEFCSVCHVRLHNLSRIKNLFPHLYFLDYFVFPVFTVLSAFLLFVPVCCVFPLFYTVSTVLICFLNLLLSHVFLVFLYFHLFSSGFPCSTPVFSVSSIFFPPPCFLLFSPVSQDSPFFCCFTVFVSVFLN